LSDPKLNAQIARKMTQAKLAARKHRRDQFVKKITSFGQPTLTSMPCSQPALNWFHI